MNCNDLNDEQRNACVRTLGTLRGRLYHLDERENQLPEMSRIALSYAVSRIDCEIEQLLRDVIADPRI